MFAQFIKLTPLKSDVSIKQQSLETEQKLMEVVTQNKVDDISKVVEDTRELQKKVPVKPLLEQFILDLEKAETVSNRVISSMSFSKDADVTIVTTETPTESSSTVQSNTTTQEPATTTDQSGTTTQEAAATADQPTAPAATNGLKKLTVSLSVESPTYEDLEKL